MRRLNRGVITICICLIALATVQCARDGRGGETEIPTLTIHAQGQHEFQFGLAGNFGPLVYLRLARGPKGSAISGSTCGSKATEESQTNRGSKEDKIATEES